jgi:hypothetical protein
VCKARRSLVAKSWWDSGATLESSVESRLRIHSWRTLSMATGTAWAGAPGLMVPGGGHPSDPAPMGFNLALVVGAEQSGAAGAEALAVATTPALKAPTQFNEKYLRSTLWADPVHGCPKKCCSIQGHYLTLSILDADGTPLAPTELTSARFAKQREETSTKFPQISELWDEKDLSYSLPTGEDETTVIKFDKMSIGQQMLQRVDRQFFAGFSQEQLETLVSTGTVHPKTLLAENKGTYSLHTVNYMHIRGRIAQDYQKFVLLAIAGQIAYEVDTQTMEPHIGAQRFESLLHIKFKGAAKSQTTPFAGRWNETSACCRDFYRRVILAPDSRSAYIACIIEFEEINPEARVAKLLDKDSLKLLKARAQKSAHEVPDKPQALLKLKQADDAAYNTETKVLEAARSAWATTFSSLPAGDNNPYNSKCVCGVRGD